MPRFIAIDTSVLHADNFQFASKKYQALRQLAQRKLAMILIPDIVRMETERHFSEEIASAINAHKSFQEKAKILRNIPEHSGRFEKIDPKLAEEALLKAFKNYIELEYVAILEPDLVDLKAIQQDYFACKAPFESGDKKCEFPDAIAIAAIKRWMKKHPNELLCVATKDGGWKKAFADCERVTIIEGVQEFVDALLTEESDAVKRFESVVQENARKLFVPEIQKALKESFGFYLSDKEGDVEDVTNIRVQELSSAVLEFSAGQWMGKVSVTAEVEFDASVHFGDDSTASYDHEDKVPIYHRYIDTTWTQELTVEAEAEVHFDWDGAEHFEVVNFTIINPSDVIGIEEDEGFVY